MIFFDRSFCEGFIIIADGGGRAGGECKIGDTWYGFSPDEISGGGGGGGRSSSSAAWIMLAVIAWDGETKAPRSIDSALGGGGRGISSSSSHSTS